MLCYIHGKTDGKLFNFYNLKDMLLQEATMSLFTKLNTRPTTLHRLFKTELLNIKPLLGHKLSHEIQMNTEMQPLSSHSPTPEDLTVSAHRPIFPHQKQKHMCSSPNSSQSNSDVLWGNGPYPINTENQNDTLLCTL